MSKVTVSIDREMLDTLMANAKHWGLVSTHTLYRMEKGVKPSRAEVVECALIKFIQAKQK